MPSEAAERLARYILNGSRGMPFEEALPIVAEAIENELRRAAREAAEAEARNSANCAVAQNDSALQKEPEPLCGAKPTPPNASTNLASDG